MSPMQSIVQLLASLYGKGVRLWLECENLHYSAPLPGLSHEDLAGLRSQKAELIAFLRQSMTASNALAALRPRKADGPVWLPPDKSGLFNILKTTPKAEQMSNSLITHALFLDGPIDCLAMCRAFAEVVTRHELLRSRVAVIDGTPMLISAPREDYNLHIVDVTNRLTANALRTARELVEEFSSQWLDLEADPLTQGCLIKLSETEHVLAVAIHHYISDAASVQIFFRELWSLYVGFATQAPLYLPQPKLQYRDFCQWVQDTRDLWLQEKEEYWARLADSAPPLRFPIDPGLDHVPIETAAPFNFSLSPSLSTAVRTYAREQGVTPAIVMFTVYLWVVGRWCNQKQFITSTMVSGRNIPVLEEVIGFFAHLVLVRIHVSGQTAADLLHSVSREFRSAWDNADYGLVLPRIQHFEEFCGSIFEWLPWIGDEIGGEAIGRTVGLSSKSFVEKPLSDPPRRSPYYLVIFLFDTYPAIRSEGWYRADAFSPTTMEKLISEILAVCAELVKPRDSVARVPSS